MLLQGVRCFRAAVVALVVSLACVALAGTARAQDPSAELSNAESAKTSAEADVSGAEAEVGPARADYTAARRKATPARRAAQSAERQARTLKADLADDERAAAGEISRIEADNQDEVDEHDRQVNGGIAFAIAALVAAGIAFGWARFRSSVLVSWLGERPRAQAIALCLFAGFALFVVGVALSGAVEMVALAVAMLGILLTIALLLALRSVDIQSGGAQPLIGQSMPSWVPSAIGALMLLLVVAAIASAILASDPEPTLASPQLQRTANGEVPLAKRRIASAATEAAALQATASRLSAKERAARRDLARKRGRLTRAEGRLASADGDVRRYTRQLAVIREREEREREEQERNEAEEQEELEEEREPESSGGCASGYSPCVPEYPPDVDCADVGGPVSVTGSDPHGLDADNDGVGCE